MVSITFVSGAIVPHWVRRLRRLQTMHRYCSTTLSNTISISQSSLIMAYTISLVLSNILEHSVSLHSCRSAQIETFY